MTDNTGKKCTSCKKGTYEETSIQDDWSGVLHCTNCKTQVKRHLVIDVHPKKKVIAPLTGNNFPLIMEGTGE